MAVGCLRALGRGRRLNRPSVRTSGKRDSVTRPTVFRRLRVTLKQLNRSQLAYKCFRRERDKGLRRARHTRFRRPRRGNSRPSRP
eukprot:6163876-Prymnesium_polylepis.1